MILNLIYLAQLLTISCVFADSDKISMYGYDAEGILNIPTDGSSGAEIGLNNFKEKI